MTIKRHNHVRSVSRPKSSLAGDPERLAVHTVSLADLVVSDRRTFFFFREQLFNRGQSLTAYAAVLITTCCVE